MLEMMGNFLTFRTRRVVLVVFFFSLLLKLSLRNLFASDSSDQITTKRKRKIIITTTTIAMIIHDRNEDYYYDQKLSSIVSNIMIHSEIMILLSFPPHPIHCPSHHCLSLSNSTNPSYESPNTIKITITITTTK